MQSGRHAGTQAGKQSDRQVCRHPAWWAGKRGRHRGCCAGACGRRQKGRQGRRSMQDDLIIFEGNSFMMYVASNGSVVFGGNKDLNIVPKNIAYFYYFIT